jgi:hypothetical protein
MSSNRKESVKGAGNHAAESTSTAPFTAMQAATERAVAQKKAAQDEMDAFHAKRKEIKTTLYVRRKMTQNGRILPYAMSCLLILWSLIFLVFRVLWGGFYTAAGYGVVAVCAVIAGVCALCLILMLILRRRFVRIGLSILRRVLFVACVCVSWTTKNALGDNDYLAAIILSALALLFCEIVCVRRYVMKRAPGSTHRVLVFAAALLLVVATALPMLPIGAKKQEFFVQGGLTARSARYDRYLDGYAVLTTVMLNADDLTEADGKAFTVCNSATICGIELPVTTVATQAFAGVYGLDAVYLPAGVVRINADAFCDSGVTSLHVGASTLNLADGLASSAISEIHLEYAGIVHIDGAPLRDGIVLKVPQSLVTEYEGHYPAWAGRILPI